MPTLRRLLAALLTAMLLAGLLPLQALAAAPVANDQSVTTTEDTATLITLIASDADLDELTYTVTGPGPTHGLLSGTAPNLTYTPAANYNGPDSFTFTASDASATSDEATVSITVTAVNDAPLTSDDPGPACGSFGAFNGSFPTPEDYLVEPPVGTCGLGVNDSDIEGGTLTFELVDPALRGTATVESDGGWSYQPDAGFFTSIPDYLSDWFTYRAWDGTDWSIPATVRLWVAPVNDAPTFTPGGDVAVEEDSGSYDEPWATSISAGPDDAGQTVDFVIESVSNPSLFATAPAISSTGHLSFTPEIDRHGSATVTVHLHDDGGLEDWGVAGVTAADTSANVTFTIIVAPVNDAPSPAATSATLEEDVESWLIPVSATDVEGDDTAAFAVATQALHGLVEPVSEISCTLPGDCAGAFLYTPAANDNGPDSFTFTARDGSATSAEATVSITVSPVNDAPVANAQSVITNEDTAKAISVTGSDPDGDMLTYIVGDPAHGLLSGTAPNLTYTPAANYSGSDSFTFTASDASATSDEATVSITVSPVNDTPVLGAIGSQAVDELVELAFSATATDVDGNGLVFGLAAGTAGTVPAGAAIDPATGAFAWTPTEIQGPGSYTFDVTVSDGALADTETITATVAEVDSAPILDPIGDRSVAENATREVTLAATDADLPAQDLTFNLVDGAPAWVTLDGTTLRLAPAFGDTSADVSACVSDGALDDCETVTVTVTNTNRGPFANAQSVTTSEDTAKAISVTGSDPDGDMLTYIVGDPAHGLLIGKAPNLTYTPAANYNGPDSFTFTARDGSATSAEATVSITVSPVNDTPEARTDGFTVNATTTTILAVLANDYSGPAVNGATSEPTDTITVKSVGTASRGTLSIAAGGAGVVYDPTGCGTGGDSFTYTITDGGGLTATATAFVTIARPGTNGLSVSPITDMPATGLVSNSTIGSTVPLRLSWCGVTKAGASVRSYKVAQSTNGGSTYPTTLYSSTTGTSSTRKLTVNTTYRWRARTVDSAGRTGSYRYSLTARVARYQESSSTITYSGPWGTTKSTSYSGGGQRWTRTAGATATITLANARQFAIVGPRSSTRGSFEVYVDGMLVATVSEKATTTVYRRVLYVRSLTTGTNVRHTIQLRAVGNGRVDLDAILALY